MPTDFSQHELQMLVQLIKILLRSGTFKFLAISEIELPISSQLGYFSVGVGRKVSSEPQWHLMQQHQRWLVDECLIERVELSGVVLHDFGFVADQLVLQVVDSRDS